MENLKAKILMKTHAVIFIFPFHMIFLRKKPSNMSKQSCSKYIIVFSELCFWQLPCQRCKKDPAVAE